MTARTFRLRRSDAGATLRGDYILRLEVDEGEVVPPPPEVTGDAILAIEIAFGSKPGDEVYVWTDVTEDYRGVQWKRGRQQELNQVETGTSALILRDLASAYDPENASSPYYPNVKPMVPVRATITIGEDVYPLFQHYVERWPRERRGPNYAERQISSVDGFELMNRASLDPTSASLTTAFGGNKDLVFTAKQPGEYGNSIAVAYYPFNKGGAGTHVYVVETTIEVYGASKTATQVRTAINADVAASKLVEAGTPPGATGTGGIVPAMAPTNLSGGEPGAFPAQTTDERVNAVADAMGWPASLRSIGAGASILDAYTFPSGGTQSVLGHLQAVTGESGEQGFLFIDAAGRLVFLGRHAQYLPPYDAAELVLVDDHQDGAVTYQGETNSYDADLIFNKFSGSRQGGATLWVEDEASRDDFLSRKHSDISSTVASDAELLALLQFRLRQFAQPMARIETLTVMPGNSTEALAALLSLELGDRVTIEETPPGGSTSSRDYVLQHLDGRLREGPLVTAQFTLGLWPTDTSTWLILDHPTLGRLDLNPLGV